MQAEELLLQQIKKIKKYKERKTENMQNISNQVTTVHLSSQKL